MFKKISLLTLLCVSFSAHAADSPEWLNKITLDGRAFVNFNYHWTGDGFTSTKGSQFNEFNIERLYLGFAWKLSESTKFRYLLDAGNLRAAGATDKPLFAITKLAYLEVADVLYNGSFLRFGMQDNPWVPSVDDLWGYRFQGTNLSDRAGYLSGQDIGVSLGGSLSEKWGSWQLSLVNGENWKNPEVSKSKDLHAFLSANPFANLDGALSHVVLAGGATLGFYGDIADGSPTDRTRLNALLGYKDKEVFSLLGEYLRTADPASKMSATFPSLKGKAPASRSQGQGFALYATFNSSLLCEDKSWELIARVDRLDPDDEIDNNSQTTTILGVAHEWNKNIKTLLDFDTTIYGGGAGKGNERKILLQTLVKF